MEQAVVTAADAVSAVAPLDPVHARARGYASRATAAATRKGYQSDWACFAAWTAAHGLDPLPARLATVGAYLAAKADNLRVSTLERRLAAKVLVITGGPGVGKTTIIRAILRILAAEGCGCSSPRRVRRREDGHETPEADREAPTLGSSSSPHSEYLASLVAW